MVMAGAFYPNYFLLGAIEEDLAVKELSGFNPRRTVMVFSYYFSADCDQTFKPLTWFLFRWGTFLLTASCITSSCSPSSARVDRLKKSPLTAPGIKNLPLTWQESSVSSSRFMSVPVPPEHTWSSTNRPRSAACCPRSLSPSSWDSSLLLRPWSSPSTQLNTLNCTPGAGMSLIWNTRGTYVCVFYFGDEAHEFMKFESAGSNFHLAGFC